MDFQGQASQDKFVANISQFKNNGYYLDIGSCDAVSTNNTYCFDAIGWKGVCIEKNSEHNASYCKRTCKYINDDATKIDYSSILVDNEYPLQIDYLSLDIDEQSTLVLKKLPLDKYRFNTITIEHDFYIHGGLFRDSQRSILQKYNYMLLFADVLVPTRDNFPPNCAFEDWWVDPLAFDINKLNKIASEKLYPEQIISMLNK